MDDPTGTTVTKTAGGPVFERVGRMSEMDRLFDIIFWQSQTATDRFHATQDLIRHYLSRRGATDNDLRLDRTAERVQRRKR